MNLIHKKTFGSFYAAKEVGISLRQLYHWVDVLKVVDPERQEHGKRSYRLFDFEDIELLKEMKRLVHDGYMPRAAARLVRKNMKLNFISDCKNIREL